MRPDEMPDLVNMQKPLKYVFSEGITSASMNYVSTAKRIGGTEER